MVSPLRGGVEVSDPSTEGYVKLGTLTSTAQQFSFPQYPSEIMMVANNVSSKSAIYIEFGWTYSKSDLGRSVYLLSGSGSQSPSLNVRSKLFFTVYSCSEGKAIYARFKTVTGETSDTNTVETIYFPLSFYSRCSSTSTYTGTVELWYKL